MSQYITREELAAELSVSASTIRRFIRSGRITPIPIGRGGRFHLPSVVAQLAEAPKRKRRAGRNNP